MRNLNWFKVNILSLPALVSLFVTFHLLIRLDPGNCLDTGLCENLPPSPIHFEIIYDVYQFLVIMILLMAVLSFGMLLYQKIRFAKGPHWGFVLLTFVLTIPLFLCLVLMIGFMLGIFGWK